MNPSLSLQVQSVPGGKKLIWEVILQLKVKEGNHVNIDLEMLCFQYTLR